MNWRYFRVWGGFIFRANDKITQGRYNGYWKSAGFTLAELGTYKESTKITKAEAFLEML